MDAHASVQLYSMCSSSVISFRVVGVELMTGDGTGIRERRAASLPGLGAHAGGRNETGQCVCDFHITANGLTFRRQSTVFHQGNVSCTLPIVLPEKAK